MPLEALVSLVITFNEGIILERLSGITEGHQRASRLDRRMAVEVSAATREQIARPLPGYRGIRRAGRRPRVLRGLRRRRADDPVRAALVARALALLEDAASVFRTALPRDRIRPAREREVRPAADERRRTPSSSTPPTRSRCWTQRGPSRRSWSRSRSAPSGRSFSPRSTGAGRGHRLHRAVAPARAQPPLSRHPVRRAARHGRGLGEVQRPLLAARLPRLRRVLHLAVVTEPHSTKQIEDGVGWGLETDAETLLTLSTGPSLGEAAIRELCSKVACPVLVIHGDEDAVTPYARGVELAEVTGRRAGDDRGRRVTALHARDPVKVNSLLRDFVAPAGARRAAGCEASRGASARSTSRRRSASAMPSGTRPSPTSCASSTPIWRSTGSLRTPSRRCWRNGASGSIRRALTSPTSPATSRASPPSTTCTASRRSGGWTRSSSRTSRCSTTSCGRSRTTSGSATRRGSSTTTCTRTRSRSRPPTCG